METTLTLALGAFCTLFLPLSGWAIRSHFKLLATEHRISLLESWQLQKREEDSYVTNQLHTIRLEITRISTLQGAMNDSIHRIENRLEDKSL